MREMRPFNENRGSVRGIFIFALLAAFAVMSLLVVVVGARAYKSIIETADAAYASRTGMSYLIGKARSADEAGMIEVQTKDGVSVLVLGGLYGGERYQTYIYCSNGAVSEYFASAEQAFSPEFGDQIFQAEALTFEQSGALLIITLVDETGETHSASICLSAGGEAGA